MENLFEKNRAWVSKMLGEDPQFFQKSAKEQTPQYYWLGCSDSRVSPSVLMGLNPGEIFVSRNPANLCSLDDDGIQVALEIAVSTLKVKHIIVCGHTCCLGVQAALGDIENESLARWLKPLTEVVSQEKLKLSSVEDVALKNQLLVSLNAQHQAVNVCRSHAVQTAWKNSQDLTVHAWVYDLSTGLFEDQNFTVSSNSELKKAIQSHQLSC